MLVDSHTHFDLMLENRAFQESELIRSLQYSNIEYAVQVSINSEGLSWSADFAEKHAEKGILYTAGIHPSSTASEGDLKKLKDFLQKESKKSRFSLLLGIGECGLDYYRLRQPEDMQIRSFEAQIDLAKKYSLPLIVHLRDAFRQGIEILKNNKADYGVMHCFAGGKEEAKTALEQGFMISFAGNVTYKNASDLHEAARYIPADMLLLETDAPFLAPVPLRGKVNTPENIKHTYRFVSKLRNITTAALEDKLLENFKRLMKK